MPNTMTMMENTQEKINFTGPACKADGWFGIHDGLHTISISVVNFTGRVYVEGSIEINPTEDDWFIIPIGDETSYIQFPINPNKPTGEYASGGDTKTIGVNIKINTLWLRARLDRSYMPDASFQDSDSLKRIGNINCITLAR